VIVAMFTVVVMVPCRCRRRTQGRPVAESAELDL
jgi:hypothetical protein